VHRFLTVLGYTIASILIGMLGVDMPPLPEKDEETKRTRPDKQARL